MTLSTSEIILLTFVSAMGVAAIVTSKTTTEEQETPAVPITPLPHPHPKNTIVIEEVFE